MHLHSRQVNQVEMGDLEADYPPSVCTLSLVLAACLSCKQVSKGIAALTHAVSIADLYS